jgi:hypothetical protein
MGRYVERGREPPHRIEPGDPDAIVLIKEEHQMFRALFDRAEETEGEALVALAGEICLRLAIHMMTEEELLYPALKPVVGVEPVDEGIVEHDLARTLIVDLVAMTGREELYKIKVHVLGEETMHHIDEEDRNLLARAREAWEKGEIDLVELGGRMRERRQTWYDRIDAMGRDREGLEIGEAGDEIEETGNPALEPSSSG